MTTLNDSLVASLFGEGYTGTLNDQLFAKLSDLTGVRTTLPDMWMKYLRGLGYSGPYNDMLMKYLGDKGYTGTMTERLYKAALEGSLFGMAVSVSITNATINSTTCDPATGSLSATVNGGVAPYTYQWTKISGDGAIATATSTSTNINFTDVCPQEQLSGTYQIQVTDSASAVVTEQVTITAFNEAVLPLSLTMSSTDGTAESETAVDINSTVSVAVSGGITPYSYSWAKVSGDGTITAGGTTSSATVTFSAVTPEATPSGVFEVTVTDNQGTVSTNSVSVGADNTYALNPFPTGEQGIFLDASDTSTLFQDSAGTTPVTAAGQPVGRWEDKSGNAYIFHQTTSTKRAVYGTDGTRHWVDFDGVDDAFVSTTNVDMTGSDEVSVFIASKIDTLGRNAAMVEFSVNPNTSSGVFNLFQLSTGDLTRYASRGTVTSNSDIATQTTAEVLSGLSKISTDSNSFYRNGVLVTSSATDQGTGNYGSYPMFLGARNQVDFPFDGRIYSLMVFGRLATAQEQTDIEAYMADKAGVTL